MASEKKDPVKPATSAPPPAASPPKAPATATVNGRPIGWDDQTAPPPKRD